MFPTDSIVDTAFGSDSAVGGADSGRLRERLLRRIDPALGRRGGRLRFDALLEARYEADTGPKRRRELLVAGSVALATYDLFLFNDQLVRPDSLALAMLFRLGVMTPIGLLILGLLYRGVPARWREWLMAGSVTAAITVSSLIFHFCGSPLAIYDPFAFSLIFVAANVVYPLRFAHAVATSALNLGVTAAFVLPSPQMPTEAKLFAGALMLGTVIFTLLANYRLEASERRSYLLLLRQSLHAEAAVHSNKALTVMNHTDMLTGLANRRAFEQRYAQAWQEARSQRSTLAVLTIDIDGFKAYNDHFGHPQGDRCLRQVAEAMRAQMRSHARGEDFIARLGGEEFIALIAGADAEAALAAAERIRAAVEQAAIPHDGRDGRRIVTVSIGVGVAEPGPDSSAELLLADSDRALYAAKRGGRNRVVFADALPPAAAALRRTSDEDFVG